MSRVAYGQKGYIGASMSANARAAYEAGEMPRSKWTKAAILGALRGYCDEMDLLYDPAVESETRAAAFREGRPKLMQDEARRAAIRETRHRACTAPILKSIKEIHR